MSSPALISGLTPYKYQNLSLETLLLQILQSQQCRVVCFYLRRSLNFLISFYLTLIQKLLSSGWLLLELVLVEARLCMQNLELKIGLCEKMVISMTDNLLLC